LAFSPRIRKIKGSLQQGRIPEMNSESLTTEVCNEIAGELQDFVGWFSGEGMTPEQFRRYVSLFEAAKLRRFGLQLSSRVSGETVHFSLRVAESGELCASMDVDPGTGVLEVQHAC
jgi:hypothetical protein